MITLARCHEHGWRCQQKAAIIASTCRAGFFCPRSPSKHLIMLSTRSSSDVRRLSVFASVEAAQEAAKAAKETSTAKTILAAKAAEAVEATKAAAAEEAKVAARDR